MAVERVEHDAGLSANPAFFRVHLDNVAHVLREIHDDGLTDGLSGQACAATPGEHRDTVALRGLDHGDHIVGGARNHNANGFDLVDAGVGAVQDACHLVETHLAFNTAFQNLDQRPCVRFGDSSSHVVSRSIGLEVGSAVSGQIRCCLRSASVRSMRLQHPVRNDNGFSKNKGR